MFFGLIPRVSGGFPCENWCHFASTVRIRSTPVLRSTYFKIFSASVLITFISAETALAVNMCVHFLWYRIMMSGLLFGMVLSVFSLWFQKMFTLLLWPVSTNFATYSHSVLCLFSLLFLWFVKVHLSTLCFVGLSVVLVTLLGTLIWCGALARHLLLLINVMFLPLDFMPIINDPLSTGRFSFRISERARDFSVLLNHPYRL